MIFHSPNLLAALTVVSCTPFVVLESRQEAPPGFTNLGPAPESEPVTLKFALTPNNLAGLEVKLQTISTPGNDDFRKWLSKDEVKSYVQPSEDTANAFNNFASTNGLEPTLVSTDGDWVALTLTVGQANQLFQAD
ncbi:Pro-kumamolisin, activation domain-containing protein [Favolaschia claudopus]|uniref:Pro-kumamolisin, activation domain-containing protein n=1 Tax=Favolaschia claudopus TaxID=2862362 RepID=A0AAV9ZXA5_9AGAR